MRPLVLDTDVVSYLFKKDSRADLFLDRLKGRNVMISFMTEAELEQWVLASDWSAKRADWLRLYITRFLIVGSSEDLSRTWAAVMVAARRNGKRIETADAWIAATAILYDAVLLTNNTKDYLGVPNLRFSDS